MKWVARILWTSLLSGGIAVGLSVLPEWDGAALYGNPVSPAFQAERPVSLTDQNLVDFFVLLPLNLNLQKVNWDYSVLSVDLEVPPGTLDEQLIYEDLFVIVRSGFERTSNVKQVLVRVMDGQNSDNGQLLLALDARREQAPKRKDVWEENGNAPGAFISEFFHVAYTHKWSAIGESDD